MKSAFLALFAAMVLSGCSSMAVVSGLDQISVQRDNEAQIRHAAFCATAANAALRRFRSQGDREAFIQLCDSEAGQ